MRRREFTTLLGSTAAMWPRLARAQRQGRIPKVGVLWHAANIEEETPYYQSLVEGFREAGLCRRTGETCYPSVIPIRFPVGACSPDFQSTPLISLISLKGLKLPEFCRASSARVAAVTSACRIRLSPTRKVEMPTRSSRARSAGAKMPLSPTISRSFGISGASASLVAKRGLEGAQIAVVDADHRRTKF